MRPDEFLEEFKIDLTPIWPAEDGRLEPIFLAGPLWIEFEEFEQLDPKLASEAPLLVEFEEFEQLDPERIDEEPDDEPAAPRPRASAVGLCGSFGVHLLPLLFLLHWSSAPAEIAQPIPVQLVIEQPPPTSEEATSPARPSPETIAETPSQVSSGAAGPAASPVRPPQTQVAAVMPRPPKPSPPPEPTPKQAVVAALPKPAPPAPAVNPPEPPPNPAPREARVPGSDTARGDYLNYLVTLTRDHFNVLPLSFLAGRRGRTILSVVVFEDGTIGRITVKRSSGYPDIDARIEQMVAAVGRFPPVPESFQRPSVELDFNMTFPDALQH